MRGNFVKNKKYERIPRNPISFPLIGYRNGYGDFSFPRNPRFPCKTPTKHWNLGEIGT